MPALQKIPPVVMEMLDSGSILLNHGENMKTTEFSLETTSKLLIRCFWMGFATLSLWGFMYLAGGELKYEIPKNWFGVTPHEFDVINYSAIIITKAFVFFGFLFPYIAIRMVLAGRARGLTEGNPE